jgi:hypothetical protein
MATATDMVSHAAAITKIPFSTIAAVKRRFGETGLWPTARGPNIPDLSTKNVAHLILGLLADTKAKDVAGAACSYYSLMNSSGQRLGDILCQMLDSFKDLEEISPVAAFAFKSRLEIDCDSPRACLTHHCTDGNTEQLFGILSKQWDDIAVRKSMTISGRSLFQFSCGIHHDHWPVGVSVVA